MPQDTPDPLDQYLRSARLSDRQRAMARSAFAAAATADELQDVMVNLNIPKEVRADLWDLKETGQVPGPRIGPAPSASEPTSAIGRFIDQVNPVSAAQRVGEAKPALAQAARGWWDNVNPIEGIYGLAHALATPEATGQTVKALYEASKAQGQQALTAAQEGRYIGAAGHAGGMLPLVGPAAAHAGERIASGDVAGGIGEGLGVITPFGLKYLNEAGQVARGARAGALFPGGGAPVSAGEAARLAVMPGPAKVAATRAQSLTAPILPALLPKNRNPQQLADIAWGEAQGIPIDAGTLSGNEFVKGTQRLASESLFGGVASKLRRAQIDALRETGERLATDVSAGAETVESAGRAGYGSVLQAERAAGRTARGHYQDFEALEADPAHLKEMGRSKAEMNKLLARRNRAMEKSLNYTPTPDDLRELRRVREELDAIDYSAGKLVPAGPDPLTGKWVPEHYVPRSGNAPVYHDVLQFAPGVSGITGREMVSGITKALETGEFDNAAVGAMKVARERVAKSQQVSKPILPPDAGQHIPDIPKTVKVQAPVDYRDVKRELRPQYDQWKRQAPFVKGSSREKAFRAMGQIINGPDYVRAFDANEQLKVLKSMAREGKEVAPVGTRTAAAGVAGLEIGALENALSEGLKPIAGAAEALEKGRAATTGKYQIREIRKLLGRKADEPTRAFDALTAKRDVNAELLEKVQQVAPTELPRMGRALLEEMLEPVTEGGGFDRAKALRARWDKVGPRTRDMLFGRTQHDIERFVRLSDVITEHMNPSGSGMVGAKAGQVVHLATSPKTAGPIAIGAAGLAKLLNSPTGARLLARGARIPVKSTAARAAWLAEVERQIEQFPQDEQEP